MLPEQLFLSLPPLLPEQEELQPPVPTVLGSVDYRTWRQRLERIDEILRTSRVEEAFVRLCLKRRLAEGKQKAEQEGRPDQRMCEGDQILFQRISSVALRTTIARTLTGASFREFSARLADSSLLQWFCRLSRLGVVRIPGKSQLQLYQERRSFLARVLIVDCHSQSLPLIGVNCLFPSSVMPRKAASCQRLVRESEVAAQPLCLAFHLAHDPAHVEDGPGDPGKQTRLIHAYTHSQSRSQS